ncbi:transposase [Novipirellula sp.]|uniref:transposase n=1 Tax=Novipirellula sp. TaxID=2795430 RepID=UPI0035623F22
MQGDFFDPKAELLVHDRLRPHWSQAGAIVFATFRCIDSIPKGVMQRWDREKNDWLQRRGLLQSRHWSDVLPKLEAPLNAEFSKQFNRCREDFLDTCRGRCLLRRPELAKIVGDALMHFDGQRYALGDFVVMPNHVHLLAAFPNADAMERQFDSWLHFTAFRIHQAIGERGHFWQQEPFDHLVRSLNQYEYLVKYIEENPRKARLKPGEYLYHRAQCR